MTDKRFETVCNIDNLRLAWNRINTSTTNLFYKDYYRELFWYYEMTLDKNLDLLSERLKNNTYEFQIPIRFYKPKQSGLQRPFSLLSIEDQIVYQAMANVMVPELLRKRRKFELKTVFSNIFSDTPKTNIYLLQNWKYGYHHFKENIKQNYEKGEIFTAHFDLAAFFDTIDHNTLTIPVMRKNNTQFGDLLLRALKTWSNTTDAKSKKILHGIPQGPVASIVFSELFLISIDEEMSFKDGYSYSRYVDDIVIQGKTKNAVLRAIISLEKLCKEKGLIPQSSKFEIFIAESADKAIGKRPSLTDDEKELMFGTPDIMKNEFEAAFNKDNFDGSKIRYILKAYKKSDVLFQSILEKFNDYYEYCDDFLNYLGNFADTKAKELLTFFEPILLNNDIPYGFVKGEIWSLIKKISDYETIPFELTIFAKNKLKSKSKIDYDEQYGIYNFLSKQHSLEYYYNIGYENSSIFQELSIRHLTLDSIEDQYSYIAFDQFEKRSLVEFNIVFQNAKTYLNIINNKVPDDKIQFASVPNKAKYETIKYTLKKEYDIKSNLDWKKFFGKDYDLATLLVYNAQLSKDINKTAWLNLTDSFNDLLIRTFIEKLKVKCPPDSQWPDIYEKGTQLIDYGSILSKNPTFTSLYPQCNDFRVLHKRRSSDLLSHAKDKKSAKPNTFVSSREQGTLLKIYKPALQSLILEIEKII